MSYRVEIIIGILALFVLSWLTLYPRIFRQTMLAHAAKTQLVAISAAATEFRKAYDRWPSSIEEIARMDPKGNILMLRGSTNDVWRHAFVFETFDEQRGYGRVISLGADGIPGGKGTNRDIVFAFAEDQGKSL